jgi:twitching motility protein PilT
VTLLDSLLDAIVRLDGEALVMHAGEKPYVVLSSAAMSTFRGPVSWGQVELSSRPLSADAVLGMLGQMLSSEQSRMLDDLGAIEHEIDAPGGSGERFIVTAARGGDDVWVEVRRRPKPAAVAAATLPAAAGHDVGSDAVPETGATPEALDPAIGAPFTTPAVMLPDAAPAEPAQPNHDAWELSLTAVAERPAAPGVSSASSPPESGDLLFEIATAAPFAQTAAARIDLEEVGAAEPPATFVIDAVSESVDGEADRVEHRLHDAFSRVPEQIAPATETAGLGTASPAAAALPSRSASVDTDAAFVKRQAALEAQADAALAAQAAALATEAEASLAARAAALEANAEAALAAQAAALAMGAESAMAAQAAVLASEAAAALAAQGAALAAEAEAALAVREAAVAVEAEAALAEQVATLAAQARSALAVKEAALAAEATEALAAQQAALAAEARAALTVKEAALAAEARAVLTAQEAALAAEAKASLTAKEAALVAEAASAMAAQAAVLEARAAAALAVREAAIAADAERILAAHKSALAEQAETALAVREAAIASEGARASAAQKFALAEHAQTALAARESALAADAASAAAAKQASLAAEADAALVSREAALLSRENALAAKEAAHSALTVSTADAIPKSAVLAVAPDGETASAEEAGTGAVVLPIARPVLKLQPPQAAGPAVSAEASLVELLRAAVGHGASTVYAVVGTRPMMRVEGQIAPVGTHGSIAEGDVDRFIFDFAPWKQVADAAPEWTCTIPDIGRVRCVTFHDHSGAGLIFHCPNANLGTADDLGLAEEVQALCREADGLIVVAGPRFGGKSTLLNAFVDLINRTRYDHVITIESQIRRVHEKRYSFISQREVRGDGDAIAAAARAALREGPDVLVIEDLRAPEALVAALDAARAGRLVFGSISAPTAALAVERLIDAFPVERRPQVRASLAGALRAVVAQILVPRAAGGRIAAREVLLSSPAVQKLLLDGTTAQLPIAIESGRTLGMRTMVDALGALVREHVVEIQEACRCAPDRAALIAALERDGVHVSDAERRA